MSDTQRRFSSRQIVTIVALITVAAVVLPVGVKAATGSAVNLTDPVTASQAARVDNLGNLKTRICQAGSVDSCANVDGGRVRVGDGFGNMTVDGMVGSYPAAAPAAIDRYMLSLGTYGDYIASPQPSTKRIAMSSLTLANSGSTTVTVRLQTLSLASGVTYCGGSITGFSVAFPRVRIGPGQTVHAPFPQPKIFSEYGTWCLRIYLESAPSGTSVDAQFVGYLI